MRTVSLAGVMLALALVLGASAQELLRDDFSGGLGKWTVSGPEAVQLSGGAVRIGPGGGLSAGDATWRDYTLTFQARTVVEARGDGHWGIHVRAVPGPGSGELYVFCRPNHIAVTGSGKTEWSFPNAPAVDRLLQHQYRLTVTGSQVLIEVDGRVIGTAHDIGNATGGISLTAYNCTAEISDLTVTALAPETAAPEPEIPLDLPAGTAARPALADLPQAIDAVVINRTGIRRVDAPVTISLSRLSFADAPNLSSIVVTDAQTGAPLPTQVDDILGTGTIPAAGTPGARYSPELSFLATVEAYSALRVRLRYTTAEGSFAPAEGPVTTDATGAKWVVESPAYRAEFGERGQFSFCQAGLAANSFLATHHPAEETLLCRRAGPVRALFIARQDIKENARLTRVIAAYPDRLHMTTTLAPVNDQKDAFVSPVGGFYFDLPALRSVEKLRYHTMAGFTEDPAGDKRPIEKLFAGPNALAYDLVVPGASVALVRRQQPDYTPGMGLIGWHGYVSGGLAFGWRPPITVRPAAPHVQDIWLVPHEGDIGEFAQIDAACRKPLVVAGPEAVREMARAREADAQALEQAAGPDAPADTRAVAQAALTHFQRAVGAEDPAAAYLEGERALGRLDLAACAREIEARLAAAEAGDGPAADQEGAPWRSSIAQARVCAAAAAWDLTADHEARGLRRLARAAELAARARAYAAQAPARVATTTRGEGLYPYVTFSEGTGRHQALVGFDVGHFWVPWGHHFAEFEVEPKPGEWRFGEVDKQFREPAEAGMATIPLLNFSPPRWWTDQFAPAKEAAGAPPGSTGDDRLISPALLGRVPEHMKPFGEYIRQIASRYGEQGDILAWSVRNEPAYYECGGINGPLMREAFDNWVKKRYRDIAELNANWGTAFADFESIEVPGKWPDNPAAWYDIMTFKAECLNGELSWEADIAMQQSPVKRTGAKFVPACSGPQSARSGYGVDPWLTSGAQRGVAFCDLYLDDQRQSALRAAELSWGAGGVPVVSCETGASSLPIERPYRWHYAPDRRARSFPWMMLGFGLYGTHYWTWGAGEEYACLDWDGTLCDFGLEAALANQEMRALRPALTGLMPRVDVGFLYPRASFIQGGREALEAYGNMYASLTQAGYQVRIVAPSDFSQVAPSLSHIIVPPAEYLETSLVEQLRRYVEGGGSLILTGNPGVYDEYTHERPGGLQMLTGAQMAGPLVGAEGRLQLAEDDLVFANSPAWLVLKPDAAQTLGSYGDGSAALTCSERGAGKVYWLGMGGCQQPGDGGRVALPTRWKFCLGDEWPQALGQGQTTTQGHTDRGTAEGWSAPGHDDRAWEDMPVPGVWEEHGHADVDGWGWYRAHLQLPAEARGKRMVLLGDTLDDRGRVYVNGTLVQETTSWDAVWRVDITEHLRPEGDNVIAVRVEDTCLLGGIRGSIALVCPDLPSSGETVLPAVLGLAGAHRTLSGGPTGVYRRVLADREGSRYLVVSNLSGADADFELTLYGAARDGATYLDLLSGAVVPSREAGQDVVLRIEVEADGVLLVKL